MALLTEHDVVNMRFKAPNSVKEGYDQDEVDFFLDEVAETIAQLTKDKAELENQVKVVQARVTELEGSGEAVEAPSPDSPVATSPLVPQGGSPAETAAGMLALAQELHDKYVSEGTAKGEQIIAEATARSEEIVSEAQDEYNRTLTQLEQERGLLERKVSELRDFERDYRTRLKSYLESLLNNVEGGSEDVEGPQD
ncbi:MAG: DivIVA domain-containing protein [Ancrocorticia sp.]